MTIYSPRACEFKPEYTGKLNFYLSALDEYVKLPDENPSIGIILCKSKSDKIVELSFRDTSKPTQHQRPNCKRGVFSPASPIIGFRERVCRPKNENARSVLWDTCMMLICEKRQDIFSATPAENRFFSNEAIVGRK